MVDVVHAEKKFGNLLFTHAKVGLSSVIVLEFPNNSVSGLMVRASLESSGYFNVNVLADLENVKANLDEHIVGTYSQIEQLARLSFSPKFEPLTANFDGLPAIVGTYKASRGAGELLDWAGQPVEFYPPLTGPDTSSSCPIAPATGWFQGSVALFQTIYDSDGQCGSGGELIDCRTPPELASVLNPPAYLADIDSAVVGDLIFFLRYFLLLRVVSEYEELRSLVSVAIATLLSRLQSVGVRNSIAVCQRSFFTHHGAHPPENRIQCCLGSFLGRVLQPQVA